MQINLTHVIPDKIHESGCSASRKKQRWSAEHKAINDMQIDPQTTPVLRSFIANLPIF